MHTSYQRHCNSFIASNNTPICASKLHKKQNACCDISLINYLKNGRKYSPGVFKQGEFNIY